MRTTFVLVTVLIAGVLLLAPVFGQEKKTEPANTPPPSAAPPGNLLIAPTRVIFEGKTRLMEVTLINVGDTEATYRLSFVRQRMTETGKLEPIEPGQEKADELFADELVRFTPREVKQLKPHEAQTVRIQLRKPENLADGEYRSHLYFRAVPPETEHTGPAEDTNGGLVIKLTPIFGISIPVIVRQGLLSAKATLSDIALQPSNDPQQSPTLTVRINRTGTQSTYGDLSVNFATGKNKPEPIARINGLAVYTPNASRLVTMPVHLRAGLELKDGHLTVRYQQKQEDGGMLWAETTIDLP